MFRSMTVIDVLAGLAIVAVLILIAIPEVRDVGTREETNALLDEARALYAAFKEYRVDHQAYYATLSPDTLQPLRGHGAYAGAVTSRLLGRRLDGFDSPDDRGPDQEFWLEMTLERDPSVRVLVADSDDAPLGGGLWLDGVYRLRNGVLAPR